MSEEGNEHTATAEENSDREQEGAARIRELQSKLQKELLALLSHPLVPQDFKDVFNELV